MTFVIFAKAWKKTKLVELRDNDERTEEKS